MKNFTLLILLFVLCYVADAQRRAQTRPEVPNPETIVRTRGRSRFSAPPSVEEDIPRRTSSRRRPEPSIQPISEKPNYPSPLPPPNYEVKENINETPEELNQVKNPLEIQPSPDTQKNDEPQEANVENSSNEQTQTVKIETELFEPAPEKIVPITRDNVRNNSRPRNSSRRNSNVQNSRPETTSNNRRSEVDSKTQRELEEKELRRKIVQNSVPKLPSHLSIPAAIPAAQITRPEATQPSLVSARKPHHPRGRVEETQTQTIPKPKQQRNNFRSNLKQVEEPQQQHQQHQFQSRGRSHETRTRNSNTTPKSEEPARTRSRPTRRPNNIVEPTPSSTVKSRGSRRRPEVPTTPIPSRRGPSAYSSIPENETPSRSRSGRKIEVKPSQSQSSVGETGRRFTSRFKTPSDEEVIPTPATRHRFTYGRPYNIDETKLEVLPLFEGETKLIGENGRRNQLEPLVSSATENERKVINPPEHNFKPSTTSKPISIGKEPTVHSFKRKPYRKTEIKESVIISEVTEVTSKRTITRKPKSSFKPKSNELSSSEEEISESDNYPEPFKALLQSKKNKFKESRSTKAPEVSTTTKKLFTEKPTKSTTTTTSTEKSVRYHGKDNNNENEIQTNSKYSTPSSISRSTRKRFYPSSTTSTTTRLPEIYSKSKKHVYPTRKIISRSTVSPLKEHKFSSTIDASFVPKATKNVHRGTHQISKSYSKVNKSEISPTPFPKSSKYSSRYRNSGSSRTATRTSTSPPVYTPTVPSFRSYTPSVVKPHEDPELGLELLTIDEPSRSLSSANLINGEIQASSEGNSLDSKDEKPQSIIEQIINSITGLTTDSTNPKSTQSTSSSTVEPTKSSAILSLTPRVSSAASKSSISSDDLTELKSTKKDKESTSEKPTTVIQRILNSLSAIQAGTTTETTTIITTTTDKPKQVGSSNFNTLSSGTTTTTPLSNNNSDLDVENSETASFSSTPAQISTTINPLMVFESITDEQVLQKKTIGKLLEILNSLTTEHTDTTKFTTDTTKLVYVTPKLSNYFSTTPHTFSGTLKTIDFSNRDGSLQTYTSSPIKEETASSTLITSTSSDMPLSIPIEISTLPTVVDNVLYESTPSAAAPIGLNIKNLLTTTLTPESTETNTPITTTEKIKSTSTTQKVTTTEKIESTTFASPKIATTESKIEKTESTTPFVSYLSTFPNYSKFEVSPESVSIFSANDLLSNAVTPEDFQTTTISIPTRVTEMLTTEKTTTSPPETTSLPTKPPATTITTTTSATPKPSSTVATMTIVTPLPTTKTPKLGPENDDISSNRIDTSSSSSKPLTSMGPDYFVFAVLPNNTILRKKPRAYPKETPFLIVGVYPNNTVIRKFPNGTLVPMEPVIRVSGFDTRPDPPPLPVITSNQVTPDQATQQQDGNPIQKMVSAMPSENSSNSVNISTTPIPTSTKMMETISTTLGDEKSVTDNIISTTTLASTTTTVLPSISELLNGNTVQAFNSIVNNTPSYKEATMMMKETTTALPTPKPTTKPTTVQTTTRAKPRTSRVTTTQTPSFFNTIISTIQSIGTTELPPTTTPFLRFSSTYREPYYTPPKTTIMPTTEEKTTVTATPWTSKPIGSTSSSTVFPYFTPEEFPTLSILSTERPRRKNSIGTPTPPPTTVKTTTTKVEKTTLNLDELLKQPIDSIKPKKALTEEQKRELETIRQLEKEQAAILKQLSFLTNLNLSPNQFNNPKATQDNLANRIVALAKERDSKKLKPKKTTTTTSTTTTTTTESTKKKTTTESDAEKERMKQIESLIKLLNMNGVTPSPKKSSTYGTSNDAILAALLKERGIGPSTPKQLAEQLEQQGIFTESDSVTKKPTRKPRPRTQPTRGPIMQRLSWLLNALAPPPPPSTRRPKPRPKSKKPKETTTQFDEDLLNNEPTQFTSVVTGPTKRSKPKEKTLSQDDIQKLIKQLEAIQKDPSQAKNFDLTAFKSLQNLNKDNVQVFMPGSSGVSQRETTKPISRTVTARSRSRSTSTSEPDFEVPTSRTRAVRTSTYSPSTVSNSLYGDDEDVDITTKSNRPTLPPVRLRPVSGIPDDAGSMVRGRLITAAVNVTRAISGFLGSALQGAASSFQTIMASGSRLMGNLAQGSSAMVTDFESEE